MRAFITQRVNDTQKLRTKLEQVENDLAMAQKAAIDGAEALKMVEEEKEAVRVEVEQLREEEKTAEAKHQKTKQENA